MTKQEFEQSRKINYVNFIIKDKIMSIDFNIENLLDLYNNQANEEQRQRIKDYILSLLDQKEEDSVKQEEEQEPTRKTPMTEQEVTELANKYYVDLTVDELTYTIDGDTTYLMYIYNNQANQKQKNRIEHYFVNLMKKTAEELQKQPEQKEKSKTQKLK